MSSQQTQQNVKQRIINEARLVLNGAHRSSQELKSLYKELETMEQFSYATDILLTRIEQDEKNGKSASLSDYQTLTKYIYKDHSLPSSFKFEKALKELNVNTSGVVSCETFGLTGAIYKRKWQFDNQFNNLELSNFYYKRGFECWKGYVSQIESNISGSEKPDKNLNDDGYTAINYAFTCELKALVKWRELGSYMDLVKETSELLTEADNVRKHILSHFIEQPFSNEPKLKEVNYNKWVIASLAEAYFGLRKYSEAIKYIQKYLAVEKNDANKEKPTYFDKDELLSWKIKSFTQQMFAIASSQLVLINEQNASSIKDGEYIKNVINEIDNTKIKECLIALGGDEIDSINAANYKATGEGKHGLALSGGGFRAALFHIGVLASLAENNKLKDFEVISCVSGGSIIGAYYYIKLKKLLETKADNAIDAADYIRIVKEIEKEFLVGVQTNLRMQIFSSIESNFEMLFSKLSDTNYSRTHRLGELYEEHLFKNIFHWGDNESRKEIYMSDLLINPHGNSGFSIVTDNWKRKNKVPQLILNATSVNTGHNWQFTASWMGEPPIGINDDIDVKPRLRRMYYSDAPSDYQKFRLGYAVAASSCVPVMFEPLPMKYLYPSVDLQLIDGGLHDNQGIASLLEQECKNIFVSDGSGQLPSNTESTNNELSLFFRADNILQERVREIQFMDLKERHQSTQLATLTTVHLKKGLSVNPINWKDCTDPSRKLVYKNDCPKETDLTEYQVLRTVQQKISEIRTDLDSFHNAESYALMYTGFVQANFVMDISSPKEQWRFLKIKNEMTNPAASHALIELLTASKKLAFKLLDLNKWVKYITRGLLVAIFLVLCFFIYTYWNSFFIEGIKVGSVAVVVILFLITLWNEPIGSVIDYKSTLKKYTMLIFAVLLGVIVSNFYLIVLNPLYNKIGKLKGKFN